MNAASKLMTEHGSTVTLRVDHIAKNRPDPAYIAYCTDIEQTELRLMIPEPSTTDLQLETGQWYRFDDVVRTRSPEATLLHPPEDINPEPVDAPEEHIAQSTGADESPWLVQLGRQKDIIAITVQPRPTDRIGNMSIADPETFEIGAVCISYCNGAGDTTVYHREESPIEDEHLLLEHVVEDIPEVEEPLLLTRGHNHDPLELLYQRLKLAGDGDIIMSGAEQVVGDCFHADADRIAHRAGTDALAEFAQQVGIETNPVRLDDYDIGATPADWRQNWAIETTPLSDVVDPRMTDRDYSVLVERYLNAEDESVASAQLAQC
ncbi:MAG: hypothetical protein J07HN6_02866, partial [Halonotius sp. J07HN6]